MGKRNDTSSSEEDYVVERVVGKKICRGKTYYRIKWLGYPEEQNTWEPLKNCTGALSLIREYEANYEQNDDEQEQSRSRSRSRNDAVKRKSKSSYQKPDVYETSKQFEGLIIDLDDMTGSKLVPELHIVRSDANRNDDGYSSRKVIDPKAKTTIRRSSERDFSDEKNTSSLDQDDDTVSELIKPKTRRNDAGSDLDNASPNPINGTLNNDPIVPSITAAASDLDPKDELKLRLSKYCDNDLEIVGLEPVKGSVEIGIRIKHDKNVVCRFSSKEVTRLWPQLYVSFLESHIVFEDKSSM